jgi:hypothetical protein
MRLGRSGSTELAEVLALPDGNDLSETYRVSRLLAIGNTRQRREPRPTILIAEPRIP